MEPSRLTRRISRSVQTTVGWIFWDPGAVTRYEGLGIPQPFSGPGGYIAARCAPLAPAGPDAVIAAFGSISPIGVGRVFELLGSTDRFADFWQARDEAVIEGLRSFSPSIAAPLEQFGPELWAVVDELPAVGRVLFAACRAMPRPSDRLLSGWHALNCIREWRGDTHWAITVANGLDHAQSSILHNEWLRYETDWLPLSRGTSAEDIEAGWDALTSMGLAADRRITPAGVELRQRIEDETDRICSLPWRILGEARTLELAELLEPPCEILLRRVDETAGVNYQPASRMHPHIG